MAAMEHPSLRAGSSWKHDAVGVRNFLIEGVSGTGKTSVCGELKRRGYHAINGDRELAIKAILKPANRRTASATSTTSGVSTR